MLQDSLFRSVSAPNSVLDSVLINRNTLPELQHLLKATYSSAAKLEIGSFIDEIKSTSNISIINGRKRRLKTVTQKTVLRKMNYTRNLESLHTELLTFVQNSQGTVSIPGASPDRSVAVSKLKQLILDSVREVVRNCHKNQQTPESLTDSEVEKVVRANLPAVQE